MPDKTKNQTVKPILRKNKNVIDETTLANDSDAKDQRIAPHYDTQAKVTEINTDVEISKESMSDAFQTDSRPNSSN